MTDDDDDDDGVFESSTDVFHVFPAAAWETGGGQSSNEFNVTKCFFLFRCSSR